MSRLKSPSIPQSTKRFLATSVNLFDSSAQLLSNELKSSIAGNMIDNLSNLDEDKDEALTYLDDSMDSIEEQLKAKDLSDRKRKRLESRLGAKELLATTIENISL